jgi:hypothetical protein
MIMNKNIQENLFPLHNSTYLEGKKKKKRTEGKSDVIVSQHHATKVYRPSEDFCFVV